MYINVAIFLSVSYTYGQSKQNLKNIVERTKIISYMTLQASAWPLPGLDPDLPRVCGLEAGLAVALPWASRDPPRSPDRVLD